MQPQQNEWKIKTQMHKTEKNSLKFSHQIINSVVEAGRPRMDHEVIESSDHLNNWADSKINYFK